MLTLKKLTEEFQRAKLAEILAQCTGPQQEHFALIYPGKVSTDDLISAYDLCERTVKKNKSDPRRNFI